MGGENEVEGGVLEREIPGVSTPLKRPGLLQWPVVGHVLLDWQIKSDRPRDNRAASAPKINPVAVEVRDEQFGILRALAHGSKIGLTPARYAPHFAERIRFPRSSISIFAMLFVVADSSWIAVANGENTILHPAVVSFMQRSVSSE